MLDLGEAHEEIDLDYAGEAVSIGFNARYLGGRPPELAQSTCTKVQEFKYRSTSVSAASGSGGRRLDGNLADVVPQIEAPDSPLHKFKDPKLDRKSTRLNSSHT